MSSRPSTCPLTHPALFSNPPYLRSVLGFCWNDAKWTMTYASEAACVCCQLHFWHPVRICVLGGGSEELVKGPRRTSPTLAGGKSIIISFPGERCCKRELLSSAEPSWFCVLPCLLRSNSSADLQDAHRSA